MDLDFLLTSSCNYSPCGVISICQQAFESEILLKLKDWDLQGLSRIGYPLDHERQVASQGTNCWQKD